MTPSAPSRRRARTAGLLLCCLAALLGTGVGVPAAADQRPTLAPDEALSVASQAAGWLAGTQLGPDGALLDSSGRPDPLGTGWTALALRANNLDAESDGPTRWLEQHVDELARQGSTDSPAGLALLVLVARAQDLPPESFGGTDLVARLEATRRPDGLFGGEASPPGTFDPEGGAPARQGLALAALGAAGRTDAAAADWLEQRQCPTGGWQFRRVDPRSTCRATPETTGYAIMGLTAVGREVPRGAIRSLFRAQRPDGGFSLFGTTTDALATALALQGLIAAGVDPNTARWRKAGGVTPFGALLRFSVPGSDGFALDPARPPDPDLTARVSIAAAGQPLPLAAPLTDDPNASGSTGSDSNGSDSNGSDSGSSSDAESGGTTTGSAGFSAVPLLAVGGGALLVVAAIYTVRRRRQAL